MLKPLNDNIVLKIVEVETTTASGIILSGNSAKPKHLEGIVFAVGTGKKLTTGEIVPLSVQEGQRVIYNGFNGTTVTHQGTEFIIIKENDILAIVE